MGGHRGAEALLSFRRDTEGLWALCGRWVARWDALTWLWGFSRQQNSISWPEGMGAGLAAGAGAGGVGTGCLLAGSDSMP